MIEINEILTWKYDIDVTEGLFKLRQAKHTRGHSLKISKTNAKTIRKHIFHSEWQTHEIV